MKPFHRCLALCGLLLSTGAALANDFPTVDRVLFVQECMKAHPGPYYEMVNKCSCAVDSLAEEVKHEDYVTMSTVVNAMTIGGERGNDLRDNETLKPLVKRYREVRDKAMQGCFINLNPAK